MKRKLNLPADQPVVRPVLIPKGRSSRLHRLNRLQRQLPSAAAMLLTLTLVLTLTIGGGASLRPSASEASATTAAAAAAGQTAVQADSLTATSPTVADAYLDGNISFMRGDTGSATDDETPTTVDPSADPSDLTDEDTYDPTADLPEPSGDSDDEEGSDPLFDANGNPLETLDPADFSADKTTYYIRVNRANVRSLPNSEAEILTILAKADKVKRVAYGTAWSKIQFDGSETGYVLTSLLTKVQPALPTPTPTSKPTPRPTARPTTKPTAKPTARPTTAPVDEPSTGGLTAEEKADMIDLAKSMLGTPYVFGGTSRDGIDCSGFTLYIYKKMCGITLPHKASSQAKSGKKVSRSNIEVGDIVCFDWSGDGVTEHVGLYIGNNKYIDASQSAGKVRQATINWSTYPVVSIRRIVY